VSKKQVDVNVSLLERKKKKLFTKKNYDKALQY